MGLDPFEPAVLNKVKLFDLLRPADSLISAFLRLLDIDSNHGHSHASLAGGLRGPLLRSFLESGVRAWSERQPIRAQVAWILGRDQTPGQSSGKLEPSDTINALKLLELVSQSKKG